MDAKDPYRAAGLVIRIYGNQAGLHVAERMLELRVLGDDVGVCAWMKVMDVLMELQATVPADGAMHQLPRLSSQTSVLNRPSPGTFIR